MASQGRNTRRRVRGFPPEDTSESRSVASSTYVTLIVVCSMRIRIEDECGEVNIPWI